MKGSLSLGRINGGEHDWIGAPTWAWRGEGEIPTVIYCHGSGGTTLSSASDYDFGLNLELARDFIDIIGDWALEGWGNDVSTNAVHNAYLYSRAMGSTGPVALVGTSMGFLTATNYARRYPQNVAAIAGIIPAVSMADILATSPSVQTGYDLAYGAAFTDANQGQTHSPIHMAERDLLPAVPIKLWCIESDSLTRLAPAQAFVDLHPDAEIELITEPWAYHGAIAVTAAQAEVANWIREIA